MHIFEQKIYVTLYTKVNTIGPNCCHLKLALQGNQYVHKSEHKEDNACTMRARYHNAQANDEMERHRTVQMLCLFLYFIMDVDEPELRWNYSKR
jgi:hypothetical protein